MPGVGAPPSGYTDVMYIGIGTIILIIILIIVLT